MSDVVIRFPAEVRDQLAERFGHYVTDEESAEMRRKMREATAAHRAALAETESSR
ncbi:hypothetical protein OHT59_19600 [Streptomyces sp. NBC_00243]|uniref:hypothetical protein n=1 Tax=Streptomyces sp. NBC_00243 TaxID=2975688 RepID=UPI002DD9CB42|nr:hypothetical protein [Streptomyces sp. NBC_00243]WRZ20547.1 hypothetical protein OHT59_19600 [Streptomyces sp. NBC_00243]